MAKGFPWDSTPDDTVELTAEQLASVFSNFISNGVMNVITDFPLTVINTNTVEIGSGIAWIDGRQYQFNGIETVTIPQIHEDKKDEYWRGILLLRCDKNNRTFYFDTATTTDDAEPQEQEGDIVLYRFKLYRTSLSLGSEIVPDMNTATAKQLFIDKLTNPKGEIHIDIETSGDDNDSPYYSSNDLEFVDETTGQKIKVATIETRLDQRDLKKQIMIKCGKSRHIISDLFMTTEFTDTYQIRRSYNGKSSKVMTSDSQKTVLGWEEPNFNPTDIHSYLIFSQGKIEAEVNGVVTELANWTSDEKLKNNIDDTNICGIDMVKALPHRQFDWVDGKGHEDIGYIAQELQRIAPSAVKEIKQNDGSVLLQVRPEVVIPYLSKALQETIARIETLERLLAAKEN